MYFFKNTEKIFSEKNLKLIFFKKNFSDFSEIKKLTIFLKYTN